MKGVILSKVGGDYEIVDHLEKPEPGRHQILVKSIVTGINPVYVILSFPSFLHNLPNNMFEAKDSCKAPD
jgi:hypothetical protein